MSRTRSFFNEGAPFHGFDDQIEEMFTFDDTLKDREIEVVKTDTNIQKVPTLAMSVLAEMNQKVRYRYSKHSLQKLATVHADLAKLFMKAADYFDIRIVSGCRTAEEQYDLYLQGRSTKDGFSKKSRHQSCLAVDAVPVPKGINMYADTRENALRWAYFTGFIYALAASDGIKIRSGWKWRTDPTKTLTRPLAANTFPDANHFEKVI